MATHFSIPAWKIPWTEEPGGLQTHGVSKSQTGLSNLAQHTYIGNKQVKIQLVEDVRWHKTLFLL